MTHKTEFTREELISICERASVPQAKWDNRDSAKAQMQVGSCLMLLKAGCEFQVMTPENTGTAPGMITCDETIWLRIFYHGYNWHTEVEHDDTPEQMNALRDGELFYLPHEGVLADLDGDWY